MKQRVFSIPFILFFAMFGAGSAGADGIADRIDGRIERSPLKNAIWGVHVEDESGAVIYSRNGDKLLVPASVRKLFSAATVASCRGMDARFETELWIDGVVEDGVLHGNLIIRGAGDPSLGSRYEPRTTEIFNGWIDAVRRAGVRMINGGVVADTSFFDDVLYPGSWKYDNIGESYAPPIDALAFNENGVGIFLKSASCDRYWVATDPWFVPIATDTNCSGRYLTLRTGEENVLAVTGNPGRSTPGELYTTLKSVSDPALYVAQAFEAKLEEAGISTIAAPRVTKDPEAAAGRVLAKIESPPLYTLLGTMLESSSNLFAEMLYKSVSRERPASWEGSQDVERYFLTQIVGLDSSSFNFEDGSGLGVENYVSTRAAVGLLRWMTDPSRRYAWQEILATPGEPGTLRRRLKNFEGRLWGKTGTLDGVRALAGYLVRPDGKLYYFAIIVNHHSVAAWQAGEVIDQILYEIDRGPLVGTSAGNR